MIHISGHKYPRTQCSCNIDCNVDADDSDDSDILDTFHMLLDPKKTDQGLIHCPVGPNVHVVMHQHELHIPRTQQRLAGQFNSCLEIQTKSNQGYAFARSRALSPPSETRASKRISQIVPWRLLNRLRNLVNQPRATTRSPVQPS